MDYINTRLRSYTIILFISTLSFTAGSDINCNGKAFHCVNSTHFKICVDLGGGVSTTVDEFLIQCPRNTVCKQYNLFECEYEITPTLPAVTIQSEVTNEHFQTSDHSVWEQLDVTTLFPTKQQGTQLSEKYYNNVNVTTASFKASFLDDAVINPSNSSNTKDLFTSSNSDINTTLNISRSIDKELAFSTTESGIDVTLSSPNNIIKLETDITVGSNYNAENPIFFTTTQDRRSEGLEPLNQNSSNLDARLIVIRSKNQVSSLSELPLSATGSLLPDNISEKSFQENPPQISNINHLIKSDNMSLERNPDILIKYNMTQLNNSENYKEHRNINSSKYPTNTSPIINTLNSTTLNVITDEIFTSNVSKTYKKSGVDSVITTESPGQHLAEITTASTAIVPWTTNHFSSHKSLYTAEAIETFLNDGLNTTTNLQNLSVTDADIMILTSNIPETSVVKTNEMPSQIKNSGLNHDISSIVLTNSILDEKSTTASNRPQLSDPKFSNDNEILHLKNKFEVNVTTELNSVNISQYLTTTEPYMYHKRNDIPISSTSKSEITAPINISEILYLSSKEATQVHNASQIDNIIESELVSTKTPKNQSHSSFLSLSNISLFTTAGTKSATFDKIIIGDNSFTSVDMFPVLTTPEMSNGVTSLKSLSDFTVKNLSSLKPVMMTVSTKLDNNNTITIEGNNNITAKIFSGITNLKTSDLTVNNETLPKSVVMTVATDLDNNNTTTTEVNNNITTKISNGVTSLKPLSDLTVKNETSPKPVMVTQATELDNNNTTTTEVNNNITAKISKGVTNLKPLSALSLKNGTSSKPVMMTVATEFNNDNIITTKVNSNITAKISKGVTNLTPISALSLKNETSSKPVMMTVATEFDNDNITTTEVNNNITAKISSGVTNFKPFSDLTVKNKTSKKTVIMTVTTDLDNNNTTTTEINNNITTKISNGVTKLKPLSALSLKNETSSKPVMMTVATEFNNDNIITTEVNNNITAKISSGFTNLKPLSDLTVSNETSKKTVIMTVTTDLDNNNTTTTEVNNNITTKISNGVTNLKPLSDLTVKNETSPKPVMVTQVTELDNNNTTTTEVNNNITRKISQGVTNMKSLSALSLKNETLSKPVMMTVAPDFDNNNITTTETSKIITSEISNGVTSLKSMSVLTAKNETWPKPVIVTVVTDLDNNNRTTTETSNNITPEIYSRVTTLKSITDLTSTSRSVFKLLSVTDTVDSFHKENVFDHTSLNNSNTSLSSFTKIPDYIFKNIHLNTDSVALNPSTDSVTRELERNTTSIIISLPTALDKPTLLTNKSSGGLDNNNITHNNDDIKFVNNSLYEINKTLSYNSTLINRTSEIYQTATDSDTGFNRMEYLTSTAAFESDNSSDVTYYNNIAVKDVLSEYRVVSNNNKNIENTLKLESRVTKPSTYSDSNTSRKHVISSETKNVTTLTPESANKDINDKKVIYKNTRNNDQILSKNNIGNPILTKLMTEDILIPKLVKNNNFSLSVALNVTNTNNNITDKKNRSFKDMEIKHNLVTKDLVEKSLTEGVINTDLNYTDKNVVSYVSNNSKTVPLTYLSRSFTKPPLTDIYNASHRYFNENISRTLTFNKITASKKYNESEDKDSSQTNKNGLAPAHAISNIGHEENQTEHLLLNTYKQVTTTAKKVNGTTLKELSYNYSEPSSYVKYDFIRKNITTSAVKSTAPNKFYSTKGSYFNKNNSIMTNKSINVNNDTNRSELADYLHLSEIPNSNLSGNVIRPLLIIQEEVNNTASLHTGNGNLSLSTGHGLQGYVSDRINKSKTSEINNVNKPEISTRVKNMTSSNNFSKNILNNWEIVNTTLLSDATKPSKTHNRNVPEIKNYTKDTTRDSSIPANNLLSSTLSQTNSIKNKTHPAESATALEISKIPSEFDKSSQPTWSLNIPKMETTRLFSNKTELEVIISKQENNTISEHTNRSNRIEEKQLGNGKSTLRVGNGVTKNIRNNTKQHQNSFTTPISNNHYSDTKSRNMRRNLEFNCTKRGKYSDANDCHKFYLCNGRIKPSIGICPKDTVFSEYLKQCTKNLTHCIRNNQFKCTAVGRFYNILCNNTYFICVKKNSSFIRFTLKCQRGYYLDKINVKCTPELINISISDENSSKNTNESFDKSVNSKNYFECEKEGKFNDPHDCRKYYVCKKGRKSTFRRNIKKCDSDEVFHKTKKKCVDVESYECDT